MATMTHWKFGQRTTHKTLAQGTISHGYNAAGANQAFTLTVAHNEKADAEKSENITLTMSRAECEYAIITLQKYLNEYP